MALVPLRPDSPDFAILTPDTDPASIEPLVLQQQEWLERRQKEEPSPRPSQFRLQFEEPLPESVLAAAGEAIRHRPVVELYAYGDADPSLEWVRHFPGLRRLTLNLARTTRLDPVAELTDLQQLDLAETFEPVSLAFLSRLQALTDLRIEGRVKDLDVIADLPALQHLAFYAVRTANLEFLREHPALEVLRLGRGSVRDFAPLTSLPHLAGLDLFGIQQLTDENLEVLSGCAALEALALDHLPQIQRLDFLKPPAAHSLRLLVLGKLRGLTSYAGLSTLPHLGGLVHYGDAPADNRLAPLTACPDLRYVVLEGRFVESEIAQLEDMFAGDFLLVGGQLRAASIPRFGAGWDDDVNIARRSRPPGWGQQPRPEPAWRNEGATPSPRTTS